jgi:A/G-specific adenine glycosylase
LLAVHGSDVLLIKRPSPGIWGGLWCLPEIGEHDDATDIACHQFGVDTFGATQDLPPFDHTFTHFRLTLCVTRLTVTRMASRSNEPGTLWLARADLPNAALPAPMAKLLAKL